MSNAIATELYETLKADTDLTALLENVPDSDGTDSEGVYVGVAPRDAGYPFITIMPVDDVPRHFHRPVEGEQADAVSFSTWDLKIWGKSMFEVGEIYDELLRILETDPFTEANETSLRGRGMPLMAEENRPNEILYSRVIECEVIH